MKITEQYAIGFGKQLDSYIVTNFARNQGYERDRACLSGYSFSPLGQADYAIGLTPCLNQSTYHILEDIAKNRLLLVAEAMNSSGDYVILEYGTGYMPLTGFIFDDIMSYCQKLARVFVHVTGSAESLGMTPHDYIQKIAD